MSSDVKLIWPSLNRFVCAILNKGFDDHAYLDQPLKDGEIHLSAPHMYCTIVERLELEKGASLSFLNIGSGSGYLSCLVAHLLGSKSLNYGVYQNGSNVRFIHNSII